MVQWLWQDRWAIRHHRPIGATAGDMAATANAFQVSGAGGRGAVQVDREAILMADLAQDRLAHQPIRPTANRFARTGAAQ